MDDSKFCNNCGEEVKKDSLDGLREAIDGSMKQASLMWFTVGFIKGSCSKSEKTKKIFKESLEKDIKKNPKFAEQYEFINSEFNKMFPQKKR